MVLVLADLPTRHQSRLLPQKYRRRPWVNLGLSRPSSCNSSAGSYSDAQLCVRATATCQRRIKSESACNCKPSAAPEALYSHHNRLINRHDRFFLSVCDGDANASTRGIGHHSFWHRAISTFLWIGCRDRPQHRRNTNGWTETCTYHR